MEKKIEERCVIVVDEDSIPMTFSGQQFCYNNTIPTTPKIGRPSTFKLAIYKISKAKVLIDKSIAYRQSKGFTDNCYQMIEIDKTTLTQ